MHNPPVAGVIYGMSHHPYQLEEREKIDEARGDFEKAGVWLRFLQSDRGKPVDDGGKMEILRLIWWFDMSLSMRMGWWSVVFQLNLHGGPSQLDSNIDSQCMCSFLRSIANALIPAWEWECFRSWSDCFWLVVWNIFYDFPFSWAYNHPKWRTP